MKRWAQPAFIAVALLVGLTIRFGLETHVSGDARDYLMPWYGFVRSRGVGALRYPFTNYTPFYTYVLLGLTHLERLAAPLALIKAVSVVFEAGCAAVTGMIARAAGGGRWAGAVAFAAVWLAPTVILNGPFWAQDDSLWTFCILVSLLLFMRGRNGLPAFAAGFAVKSQSVFLGPFMLGMMVRRRSLWPWLAAVPALYLLLAVPVLLAGRRFDSVMEIYLDQTNTYHHLSLNAANFWIFWSLDETVGVVAGLLLATLGGLFVAALTARVSPDDREGLLAAACLSLLTMPFLLPKMHDRYFYAFEVASVALACANPRYVGLAVVAQIDGVLSYMMLDRKLGMQLLAPAAICNAGMAVVLVAQLIRPMPGRRSSSPLVATVVAAGGALVLNLLITSPRVGRVGWFPLYAAAFCFTGLLLLLDIRRGGARAASIP